MYNDSLFNSIARILRSSGQTDMLMAEYLESGRSEPPTIDTRLGPSTTHDSNGQEIVERFNAPETIGAKKEFFSIKIGPIVDLKAGGPVGIIGCVAALTAILV